MRILVTGGAGYIGSHFSKTAEKAGHQVTIWDNLSTGHRHLARSLELISGDLLETQRLIQVLTTKKIEAVVHFAAKALVEESVRHPELYWKNNFEGTESLLKAVESVQVPHLVFSSSCAVYGLPERVPIQESDLKKPTHAYGETKWRCEELIHERAGQKKLQAACLRYFNVIGCDPEGELQEIHDPETHIVPNVVRALLNEREFSLFGGDYKTSDGTCVRDYVDVNDLALVHLDALEWLVRNPNENLLISNVGSGIGISNRQVVEKVAKVYGRPLKIAMNDRRAGDPPELVADPRFFRTWCRRPLRSFEDSISNLVKSGFR